MVVPSKVLYVDLSRRRFWVEDRKDLFELYLGGIGVGMKLLAEECPRSADPLGEENPIILSVGVFTGLFPLASKTVAVFKSPLTGNLGESHAGGRSAIAIRSAGYGAIVIKGASETPVYLAIHGGKVHFRDASGIWGMRSVYTVGRVIRELEPGAGIRTIMRIGVAGEKMVRYACVTTETYRHFGRLGLGAVFGSKKLKALAVSGKERIKVSDVRKYRGVYNEIFETAVKSPLMKKYHDLGTAMNIIPLNEIDALPTMNLKSGRFDRADEISGENMANKYLGRRLACAHCPVACIHLAALREPYVDEPYFYKTTMISYDYEPLYSLGSMLGIGDAERWLKVMDEIENWGLDAISTGVTLAWATEAFERGIITERETAGLRPRWGDSGTYIEMVRLIIRQPNRFYRDLAMGVEHASSVYGGRDFALAFGGNEMPGYHTGPLTYATCLTGARHSHLDSAGYSYDQKYLKGEGLPSAEEAARRLLDEEVWRQVLNSLVVCLFARRVYSEDIVVKGLEVVGLEYTERDLKRLGLEVLRVKHAFKRAEGFSHDKLRIPRRILETPTAHGRIGERYLKAVVKSYFEMLNAE